MAITFKEVLTAVREATAPQKEQLKKALGIKGLLQGTEFKLGGGALSDIGQDTTLVFNTLEELQKNVGNAGKALQGELSQLIEFSKNLTGTSEAARSAIIGLSESMQSFTFRSAEDSRQLAQLGIQLNKLGVGYAQLGEILDMASLGFGKNQTELKNLSLELAGIVTAFPGQASQIARNFQQAQTSLAYDSGRIMTVFKKLQETSSLTGVSFNALTSAFGESMDSFQGSSEKAGNLNAILGKSVFNAIDLLGKSEEQRLETIVAGVRRNIGGSVNDLGKFQLKAIAEGLGLNVSDTRRLLMGQISADQAIAKATEAKKTPQDIAREKLTTALGSLDMSTNKLRLAYVGVESPLRRAEIMRQKEARSAITRGLKDLVDAGENKNIRDSATLVNQIINSIMVGEGSSIPDRIAQNINTDPAVLNKLRLDKERFGGFAAEEKAVQDLVVDLLRAGAKGDVGEVARLLREADVGTKEQKTKIDNAIEKSRKINEIKNKRIKEEKDPTPDDPNDNGDDNGDDDPITGESILEKFLRLFTSNKIKIEITGLTDPDTATAIVRAAK